MIKITNIVALLLLAVVGTLTVSEDFSSGKAIAEDAGSRSFHYPG